MTDYSLTTSLLEWYQSNGRNLPWRVKGGAHPNPYIVLISEVMLQQTTVATVIPYFERFIKRFPTIFDLAAANIDEIYQYWEGLGYYSRARSLLSSVQKIVKEYKGIIPQTKEEILNLKGIGPYTAASILALGFNQAETVIDGNVIRVICRLYHLTSPINTLKQQIRELAENLTSQQHPADYASAIMDLGALICTPQNPQCLICPWNKKCQSFGQTDIDLIPLRPKISKKEKCGNVYIITNKIGQILIEKRREKGLLSGLWEFPWDEKCLFENAIDTGLNISHTFTHFKLTLKIYTLTTTNFSKGKFISPKDFKNYAFSTLMKKVWKTYSTKNY